MDTTPGRPAYPEPPRSDTVDYYHGEAVADPFRPLEEDSDATRRWVEAEAALTEAYLAARPEREAIRSRVAELWDHPRHGVPFERGGRWFQMRNRGLDPQSVLYVSDRPGGGGRPLIDPNGWAHDGTAALSSVHPNRDGTLLAYAISRAGSDWNTWRVRDTATGSDSADVVEWSKFSGAAWHPDGSGFYYGALDAPEAGGELTAGLRSPRVQFHRIGSDPADDVVVYDPGPGSGWSADAEVTPGGDHLVVTVHRGTGPETLVLVGPLTAGVVAPELSALTPAFEFKAHVVDHLDDGFVVLTDHGAERGRLVLARPGSGPGDWVELVPATDDTLVEAWHYGGRLVGHYLRHARSALRVHHLDGSPDHEVDLPGLVALAPGPLGSSVEGRPDSPTVTYVVVSFTESGAVWTHDLHTGRSERLTGSGADLGSDRYVTEQVFVPSPDGTMVPVFLTRRRDAEPDGTGRALLYGYGGFDVPVTPSFSVGFAAWLDRGGILAVANLRGGGEYGRAWHDAGRLGAKQNVFDDFCAVARWLVDSGWSRSGSVAITGGSNGGLLVGACLTQHPELFGAAVPAVGVMDMLRFDRFTIGWAWRADYGDPASPEQFAWLRAYSPLHNVRPGTCYPPTMIMTADHDDRVIPAHSYKFAAALQAAQSCDRPVLLRVEESAGHGAGKPTDKLVAEATDRLAFLEAVLGP